MTEKRKNDKNYQVEWSFSFEGISDKVNQMLGSLGENVTQEPVRTEINQPLGDTRQAHIKIEGSVGKRNIHAIADGDDLIQVEAVYSHPLEIVQGKTAPDGSQSFKVKSAKDNVSEPVKRFFGAIIGRGEMFWNVGLSSRIPLRLELEGGVGPSVVDLTGLDLNALELEGGVGQMKLTLPENERHYEVDVEGGVGEVIVNIPAQSNLTMDIDGGVGQIRLNVAEGVALRVEAESGIGSVRVPDHMTKLKDDGEMFSRSSIWESEGFALARNRVTVRYEGGIGAFVIKQQMGEAV